MSKATWSCREEIPHLRSGDLVRWDRSLWMAFERFGVRATPVFAFFDPDGRLLVRYTGPTANVEEFLWLGEYVTSQAYRDTSFAVYKRERRKQAVAR